MRQIDISLVTDHLIVSNHLLSQLCLAQFSDLGWQGFAVKINTDLAKQTLASRIWIDCYIVGNLHDC